MSGKDSSPELWLLLFSDEYSSKFRHNLKVMERRQDKTLMLNVRIKSLMQCIAHEAEVVYFYTSYSSIRTQYFLF